MGFVTGEAALEYAGPGLREVCEATGMPPVLHMGSCVDNTRILTVLTQMAQEGGLGDDSGDIPAVGLAPEWMSEKALAIGAYAAASGVAVIFGLDSPVEYSDDVVRVMDQVWEKELGGRMIFVKDDEGMLKESLAHIDKKRAALGLPAYDPSRFGKSGDWRVAKLMELPLEARAEALYGGMPA
jgi:carbon-monoxide dehydrogenase catalytic subunit